MDHLTLPRGQALVTRRMRGNPMPAPVVRRVQHGPELADQLDEVAATLPAEVLEDEQNDARIVLKVSASTRLQPGPMNKLSLASLGEGEGWTYFVLSTRESRESLMGLLREYSALPDDVVADLDWARPKTWAAFVDTITGIELYGPSDRRDPSLTDLDFADGTDVVDCLLWPTASNAAATQRVNDLTSMVNNWGLEDPRVRVVASDSRSDRTLVRAVVTTRQLDELLEEVDVERVRAPLRAAVTAAELRSFTLPADLAGPASTPIGVVDGVVNTVNPLTGPYILAAQEFPASHTFSAADEHGTAVAGTAVWGDLDGLVLRTAAPTPHPVVSARVLDEAASGFLEVPGLAHLTIEQAIRWLVASHHVRVINLSINSRYSATAPLRDELTATVDLLARELQVVIVVSAGNRFDIGSAHWRDDYPAYLNEIESRIAAPGDAALAVTVGAHAERDTPEGRNSHELTAVAASGEPSPFSRTGPVRSAGSSGVMKPELSHHGGNVTWNGLSGSVGTQNAGTSAIVAIPPRGARIVGANNGTSYAAPAVAHEIARIADRYPDAGPNLLRSLVVLSARPTTGRPMRQRQYSSGYGKPDADMVLESSAQRVFLTFEGQMRTSSIVVHRLPVPSAFAEGVRRRTVRVGLAFDPPIARSRREYVAGTMTVELVRGLSFEDVTRTYSRQPTLAQVDENPALERMMLPRPENRPPLEPGVSVIASNTLIRRDFVNGPWDPDHGDYFLIVSHQQSNWTARQKREYAEQAYALAVEISEEGASDLDLYALVRAQLRARVRRRA